MNNVCNDYVVFIKGIVADFNSGFLFEVKRYFLQLICLIDSSNIHKVNESGVILHGPSYRLLEIKVFPVILTFSTCDVF